MQQKFIVAVPTSDLVNQTYHDLKGMVQSLHLVKLLSEDNVFVHAELLKCLAPSSCARVVVITHKALEKLGKQLLLDSSLQAVLAKFIVIVDELPAAVIQSKVKINSLGNHMWTEFFTTSPRVVGDSGEYLNLSKFERAKSFYQDSQNGDEHTKNALWSALAGYPLIKNRVSSGGFTIYAYSHSPVMEIIKTVREFYLASSNVLMSPFVKVAKLWCGIDSEMAPAELQPVDAVHNSYRVTCHALLDGRASLSILSKFNFFERVCAAVVSLLNDSFIYATNGNKSGAISCRFKDIADDVFKDIGVRVPFISHGLNLYGGQEVHKYTDDDLINLGVNDLELYKNGFAKAAWLGVARLNGEVTTHINEISKLIDADGGKIVSALETFASCEAAYQFVLRSRLRNRNDETPVVFVFIDYHSMKYFVDVYGGNSKIGKVGVIAFETKKDRSIAAVQQCKRSGMTRAETISVTGFSKRTVDEYW